MRYVWLLTLLTACESKQYTPPTCDYAWVPDRIIDLSDGRAYERATAHDVFRGCEITVYFSDDSSISNVYDYTHGKIIIDNMNSVQYAVSIESGNNGEQRNEN